MNVLRNFKRFLAKAIRQPGYAFKVFQKRLIGYFYYKISKGQASYPEAVTLFLTHRCNLRCKMCGQWGEGGVTKKDSPQHIQAELSLAELKAVIDDLAIFKPNITLFGGEPLLFQNSLELIRHIKSQGIHCLMITNGSLLGKLAAGVVDSGLDELNISLDGKAELHDQIRGLPGLYEEIMDGLKQVQNFKIAKNKKYPLVNLQCTITKYNYQHLEQLLEVAQETGANSLTFHNLIFLDRELLERQKKFNSILGCDSVNWEGFVFDPELDAEELYRQMQKIKSVHYPFSVDFYPNFSRSEFLDYYQNKNYQPNEGQARCLSPWIVAYIFPDGEVRPCLNFSYSYGNVKTTKFKDIWNSENALKFRRQLKDSKIFPVCARCTELYRY